MVTDDELISAVRIALQNKREPVVTTADIAAHVEMTDRSVRDRLKKLAERDGLNRGQIARGKVDVYWFDDC